MRGFLWGKGKRSSSSSFPTVEAFWCLWGSLVSIVAENWLWYFIYWGKRFKEWQVAVDYCCNVNILFPLHLVHFPSVAYIEKRREDFWWIITFFAHLQSFSRGGVTKVIFGLISHVSIYSFFWFEINDRWEKVIKCI